MKLLRSAPLEYLVGGACLVVLTLGVRTAAPMLNPMLMAAFLALLFQPTTRSLQKRRVPGALAIGVVVLAVVLCGLAVVGFMAASLRQLAGQIPEYRDRLAVQLTGLSETLAENGIPLARYLEEFVQGGRLANLALSITSGLAGTFGAMSLTLIIFAFVLGGMSRLEARIAAGQASNTDLGGRFLAFSTTMRGYMGVRAVLGAVTAVIQYVLLLVVGVEYAALWGVLSFILSFVPNIGFTLSVIPPALLALVLLGWQPALIVVIGYVVVNNIIDNIVAPRIIGQQMSMSPLESFLSVVFWAWVLGPTGAILSVPLTVFFKEMTFGKPVKAVAAAPAPPPAPAAPIAPAAPAETQAVVAT